MGARGHLAWLSQRHSEGRRVPPPTNGCWNMTISLTDPFKGLAASKVTMDVSVESEDRLARAAFRARWPIYLGCDGATGFTHNA